LARYHVVKDGQMTTTLPTQRATQLQPAPLSRIDHSALVRALTPNPSPAGTDLTRTGVAQVGRRAVLALFGGAALAACGVSGATPEAGKPSPFATPAGTTKFAVIELEKGGTITFSMFGNDAPQTVKNFEAKVAQGFYNGLKFHRVEDWVVQGGDPSGNGTGGGQMPSEYNAREFKTGAVGIARGQDPRINNDAQFFIVKRDSAHLNGQYTNFGQVTDGLDLVVKIAIGDKIKKITLK
jgi:cyclophilin family peptidyl-prolyl cis-trans isomerase